MKKKKLINTKSFFCLGLIYLMSVTYIQAQQLDQIGKKGGIKVSGGAGLTNSFYTTDGISNRLNPYSYLLTGNITFSAYGITLPFSFSFSNQSYTYRQPFNIVGVSPTYKKWVFHAGYRNMSFSPYSLSGHNFLGGGIEYRGDKFYFMAMSGRLLRAVEYDSININVLPAYERFGGGLKIGYRNNGDEISVSNFYAKDNVNSISDIPFNVGLTPQENVVWTVQGKKKIGAKLLLSGDLARSAWTRDLNAENMTNTNTGLLSPLFYLSWKESTVAYNALKASATYDFTYFTLGGTFERVDPEYKTLGAYFNNNDFQNVTANFTTDLFKKKVKLAANVGRQRDDLNNTKSSRMKRTIGSINLSMALSKKVSMQLSYSNFYSFINVKPLDLALLPNARYDTLNFIQLSQTLNGSISVRLLESDRLSRNFRASSSYMMASNRQVATTTNSMINASMGVDQSWKKSGITVGINANANQASYEAGNSIYVGVGVNTGMPVWKKKIRVSLGVNGNQNYQNSLMVAQLLTVSNSYSMKLGKHQSLNASLRYTGRFKKDEATLGAYNTNFNEFLGSLSYNYTF